jgi:hypothetical protein
VTPTHGPPNQELRPPFCRLGGAVFAAINSSIWTYPRCCCDVGGHAFTAVADGEAVAAVEDAVNDLHPGASGTEDVLWGGRVSIILLAQTKLKTEIYQLIRNKLKDIYAHYQYISINTTVRSKPHHAL